MFNFNFKQIFSASYIFDKAPPYQSNFLFIVAVFVLFIAVAFGAWFWFERKRRHLALYRKMQKSIFNLFFYTGLAGLVLSFFHWQEIEYLGSRFFFLILFFVFIVIGLSIIDFRFRILPAEIKKYNQKKAFEKYLPRRGRR